MSKVFTIPFGQPFLETLAEGIMERFSSNPLLLAKTLVILPTRRGCLGLKEAFQQRRYSQILPRIIALADLEQEPTVPGFIASPLPPAMPVAQQLGLLSQLILKKEQTSITTALNLAKELITLLYEIHTSDSYMARLHTLVGNQFAQHWQITLDFLKIITDYWPSILQDYGMMDGAQRRRDNLRMLAHHWRPTYPVILAGTTATRPATADLAKAILNFQNGHIILPGFEALSEDLPPTHPLYTLHQFVDRLGHPEITPWVPLATPAKARGNLLQQAMAPIINVPQPFPAKDYQDIIANLSMIECRDTGQEALIIALKIRQSLAEGLESIIVITPDMDLTRRLQSQLKRWNIIANTSQGKPLTKTVVGTFLSLITQFRSQPTPRGLLALLKHPFCYRHLNRADHLAHVRQLDLRLRRLRQPNLLSADSIREEDRQWYERFLKDMALTDPASKKSLTEHLQDLIKIAETLCSPDHLWLETDGQSAAEFLASLQPYAGFYSSLSSREFRDLLPQLMDQELVHDRHGIGSPVRILGALEARQAYAPLMILAGLNEGTWPQENTADPWLNRQMRLDLGLPDPLRRIGLSAHDFCLGFSAPQAMLTRSMRKNGAATVPSRWWLRLETILSIHDIKLDEGKQLKEWAQQLDAPKEVEPASEPLPCPPLDKRPIHFSTTDIEQLMRDPFGYYARRILKLRKLDAPDEDLASRDLGNLIHEGLDLYHRQYGNMIDLGKLITCGEKTFAPFIADPHVQHFWWPRFVSVAEWLVNEWGKRKLDHTFTEIEGTLEFPYGNKKSATITSIADRIDVMDGRAIILDYKTGSTLPTKSDIIAGLSPQLMIEALLLLQNGFSSLSNQSLASLEYWHLKGGREGGTLVSLKDISLLIESTEQGIKQLFQHFLMSPTPYLCIPWGESKLKNRDYSQLARLEEWNS
ncbi:MAG: PD-(D/E)XK nuclease family protein [Candidatus Paracaedibacteraceae bacterium]|nr:PD-(D/E)XK nuclease family protein [Candidatus Paracaedibacteraceae bacterium]